MQHSRAPPRERARSRIVPPPARHPEDWYFIAEQPAPAPHLAHPEEFAALCIVLVTVLHVSSSCEYFSGWIRSPPPTLSHPLLAPHPSPPTPPVSSTVGQANFVLPESACYVTRFAPHNALKFIACIKVDFSEFL